ncbi:MAG: hypothetical protein E6J90_48355 [Deltaproteobacteria bacterium]|nr:MAG: hypothetical protein E6J90_48355 [Deltaproteobacteria bacterium]
MVPTLLWLALSGLAGCGDNEPPAPDRIALAPSILRVAAGASLEVAASYVGADHTLTAATDVTWSIGDAVIAMVTPGAAGHATIRGIDAGTTTVTVAGQGIADAFTVTVTGP